MRIKFKWWLAAGWVLLATGLAACGGGGEIMAPPPPQAPTILGPATQVPGQPAPSTAAPVGSKTALPFFTPDTARGGVTPSPTGFTLAFEDTPGRLVLEASVVYPLPQGGPDDWALQVDAEGLARLTANPRDKAKTVVQERYLSPEKRQALLAQLEKMGVLDWPDTTPPGKMSTGGASRGLSLYLKGRPKLITDLTGQTGDRLGDMLALIRQTVEAAPLRNSP